MVLTELEKTILFVVTMESKGRAISPKKIMNKFKPRQKRLVQKYMIKLQKKNLLEKSNGSYRLTKKGTVQASRLLVTGVNLP